MTEREAQELVRMIESNWQMDLGTARGMWRDELVPYTSESALRVITRLATTTSGRLRLDMLHEVLRQYGKLEGGVEERVPPPEPKRGESAPEWAWVWSWARHQRSPRNLIPFPQQESHADPDLVMSMDEYETLRQEWHEAGSPKSGHPLPAVKY